MPSHFPRKDVVDWETEGPISESYDYFHMIEIWVFLFVGPAFFFTYQFINKPYFTRFLSYDQLGKKTKTRRHAALHWLSFYGLDL